MGHPSRTQFRFSLPAALMLALTATASRSAVVFDTSFNGTGSVSTNLTNGADEALYAIQQADGKVVTVGFGTANRVNVYAVARYNADGSLDTTFHSSGKNTTSLLGKADRAQTIVQQSDGKLVAVGLAAYNNARYQYGLVRYTVGGELDTTYGSGGKAIGLPAGYSDVELGDAAIQSGDAVLASGMCLKISTNLYGFCLMRFQSDGSVDTSYGTNGIAYYNIAGPGFGSQGYRMAQLADGKVLVAGAVAVRNGNAAWGVMRVTASGALDTTFNATGTTPGATSINPGNYGDMVTGLGVLSDGSIVVGGRISKNALNSSVNWGLAKFSADGAIDTSFGNAGLVTTAVGTGNGEGDVMNHLAVQADDKIVTVGYAASGSIYKVAAVRYAANGSLDASFNGNGIYTATIASTNAALSSVWVQPDGKLLFSGYQATGTDDFLTMRLLP